ncbi:MAG TPA: DUF1707 domain-containing protein [Euzebyales bacterium]|nr:DUF1707 domain-containing protein [Euzebyales bacterium]
MDPTDNSGRDRDRRMRIGDAERDEVLNALQEHLAAGRLDVDEYEQRAERVVAARYAEDLDEVLADLPPTEAQQQRRRQARRPQWQGALPFPVPLMIGLAVLAVIALPGPPFLLFPLLWFLLLAAFFGRRRWAARGGWDDCAGRRVV